MTKPADNKPIPGYRDIAAAVGRALQQSVSERTARRWSQQNRAHRLPVCAYPNGRVFLLPADLDLWVRSWTAPRPSGGRPPGAKPKNTVAPMKTAATHDQGVVT